MNRLSQILFKIAFTLLCLISIGAQGQKQSKTFNESFTVVEDAVLNINTTHADIQFETWDKNEVSIEYTIAIEGATAEEAKDYFNNGNIDVKGNSRAIDINTGVDNTWFFKQATGGFNSHHSNYQNFTDVLVKIPELPEFPEIAEIIEIARLVEEPPMPPVSIHSFDYEAYKKDGDKYMKKWKKEFDKGFDDKYKERLEAWGERMAEREEVLEEKRTERMKKYQKRREKLLLDRDELLERRTKRLKEREQEMKTRQKNLQEIRMTLINTRKQLDSAQYFFIDSDSLVKGPNVFFSSSKGKAKNYKVKKTIKIKLPKSVKIQMNVRHGEVKLAQNTRNINATLSYAKLLAATIDGKETVISASYSPVSVQNWNYGQLKAEYCNAINLKQVGSLGLSSNSSNITIERLNKSVYVKNKFGPLFIESISANFKEIDISMENAELECKIPVTAFQVYINGTSSKLISPNSLKLVKTNNLNSTLYKGYHIKNGSAKSINISSNYSEITLKE